MTDASRELAAKLAYELIGPVIAQYLMRLDAQVRYAARTGAKVLFVSRAGARIQSLYREFLAARKLPPAGPEELLWTTDWLTANAVWSRTPDQALKVIGTRFHGDGLRSVCAALLKSSGKAHEALNCADIELDLPASQLQEFLRSSHPLAETLVEHLRLQGALFDKCLRQSAGNARRIVLADIGWEGAIQTLLARAFPEYVWSGVYFGAIPSSSADQRTLARATGLMFESNRFDPDFPSTAFVLFRHLIEALFEADDKNVPLDSNAESGVWISGSNPPPAGTAISPTEPVYCSVLAYVREITATQGLAEIDQNGTTAMRELGRILAYPTREQALALGGVFGPANLERPMRPPVLIDPENPEQCERRVRAALWPQGQIALEYPKELVHVRQNTQLGLTASSEELFPPFRPRNSPILPDLEQDRATIAVIVRTVNRPQFLRRALLSIGQQTFQDYICVVVCDGGDLAAVVFECTQAPIDPRRLMVIDNKTSHGMEAASNIGIGRVMSEFITVHDDDDSWEPEFLQRAVAFLGDPNRARYGGVVTWATYVSEVTTPAGPVIKNRRPFRTDNVVQIMEMARGNLFPPIAFLFRRKIYDRLGGYNETLPVLGDWEFNLRFLLEADIGVIGDPLANYHHRDLEPDPAFGNTVISERDRHAEFDAVVRNSLLRSMLANDRSAGLLAVLGTPGANRAAQVIDEKGLGPKSVNAILRAISIVDSDCLKRKLNDPWYLKGNPDIAKAGVDPYSHWIRVGAQEGRLPAPDLVDLARELVYEREATLRAAIEKKELELRRINGETLIEPTRAKGGGEV
jgi:glycosyltransferase involved in cell wall biosynthesis